MKPQWQDKSEVQEDAEEWLYQAIAAIQTPEEAKNFFQDLCTPTEIQAMADRWLVVGLIKQGIPYRQIYEMTGVSVTTVGRVARHAILGVGGYGLIYDRLQAKGLQPEQLQDEKPKARLQPGKLQSAEFQSEENRLCHQLDCE